MSDFLKKMKDSLEKGEVSDYTETFKKVLYKSEKSIFNYENSSEKFDINKLEKKYNDELELKNNYPEFDKMIKLYNDLVFSISTIDISKLNEIQIESYNKIKNNLIK